MQPYLSAAKTFDGQATRGSFAALTVMVDRSFKSVDVPMKVDMFPEAYPFEIVTV